MHCVIAFALRRVELWFVVPAERQVKSTAMRGVDKRCIENDLGACQCSSCRLDWFVVGKWWQVVTYRWAAKKYHRLLVF